MKRNIEKQRNQAKNLFDMLSIKYFLKKVIV